MDAVAVALTLGVSIQEARLFIEESKPVEDKADENSETHRCDSDELSLALGISKEEASLLVQQNIAHLTAPKRIEEVSACIENSSVLFEPARNTEELAAELGIPSEELKCLMGQEEPFPKNDDDKEIVSRDDEFALALSLQDADARQDEEVEKDAEFAFALSLEDADARQNQEAQLLCDAMLSAQLSEPEFQCLACLDTFRVSEMFTVDCPAAHRFCFEDIRRLIEARLQRRELATCPLCKDPPHQISEDEVRQLFGRGTQLDALHDATLRTALASADDVVACPTPDCPEYLVLSSRYPRVHKYASTHSKTQFYRAL